MSVNNRPFFGDHLYLSGMPSRHFEETIADGCLSFPRHLSPNVKVEVILDGEEHKLVTHYGERGCIYQLFSGTISCLETNGIFPCCAFPTLIVMGIGALVTCIAAKPFELIGKCIKNSVLETNPRARDYNEMAVNHLQMLKDHDVYPDRIERLKSKLESEIALLSLYENLHSLLIAKTKYRPVFPKKTTLVSPSASIDLMITPILDKDEVVDYRISALFDSIPGLPTIQSALGKDIQHHKNNIQKLEKEIDEKSKLFINAAEKFEQNVRALLNRENDEVIPLIKQTNAQTVG